jgi:hypothetical protein
MVVDHCGADELAAPLNSSFAREPVPGLPALPFLEGQSRFLEATILCSPTVTEAVGAVQLITKAACKRFSGSL